MLAMLANEICEGIYAVIININVSKNNYHPLIPKLTFIVIFLHSYDFNQLTLHVVCFKLKLLILMVEMVESNSKAWLTILNII